MTRMLLAGLLVLGAVAMGEAQMLYRYVGPDGQVHMTDDPNKLPKAKSGTTDAMAMPKAPPAAARSGFDQMADYCAFLATYDARALSPAQRTQCDELAREQARRQMRAR